MRIILPSLFLAALASCATSEAKTSTSDVDVQLASVTLADDCGTPPPAQQFSKPPPTADTAQRSERRPAQGSCAHPGPCGSPRRACEPTSMQLSLTAKAGARPTTIKIKRVELLDSKGKVLEVLSSSLPTQWSPKGGYGTRRSRVAPTSRRATA
jgi:hypothetical protein